ncbi:MAG: hypothetical protein OHK0029_30090 [Armatimonadaceae bacterium]
MDYGWLNTAGICFLENCCAVVTGTAFVLAVLISGAALIRIGVRAIYRQRTSFDPLQESRSM